LQIKKENKKKVHNATTMYGTTPFYIPTTKIPLGGGRRGHLMLFL
jgi:hypothetical protein